MAMTDGKWIQGISPNQPVSLAARRVLQSRLVAVWYWLPLAAENSQQDIEHVHTLRVASRRAVEAVRTFRKLVPQTRYDEIRQRLRGVRQAANDARDWDVMGERFSRLAASSPESAASSILGRIKTWRQEAQQPIMAVYRQLTEDQFDQQVAQLVEDLRFCPVRSGKREPKFRRVARNRLRSVVKKFFKASCRDLSDPLALHDFRIRGKKLRYTMEIVAAGFGNGFRKKLYPRIEALQDRLGKINDHFIAQRRFQQWVTTCESAEERKCLEELIAAEQTALSNSYQDFLAWWAPERISKLRRRFKAHLSGRAMV